MIHVPLLSADCEWKSQRRGKEPNGYVFTHDSGEPIRDFRGALDAVVRTAKFPGALFCDLRRSAVRNKIRPGMPQKTAHEISGHKTDSVFNRCNIVSEDDIGDAARKIERGAKVARKGDIHRSFIVETETTAD